MTAKIDCYTNIIDEYLDRTLKIRRLSVPSVSDAYDEKRYRMLFGENARRIEPLFEENQKIIDEILFPVLSSDHVLSSEDIEFLNLFAQKLQNNSGVEYTDASLLWRISDRLFQDAVSKDDIDYLVNQLDLRIIAATGKSIQAKSLVGCEDIWTAYQKKGAEAVEMMFNYLEKDTFKAIENEETRELLVINSRYFCVIYEAINQDPDINEMVIDRLIKSYEMSFDPDYTELLPDYDWTRHRVKCLEYLGQLTERNNEQGITESQAKRILEYVYKLKDFYDKDKATAEKYISSADIDLFITKNSYYSGLISNEDYKNTLIYYYKNRFSDRLGARFKEYETFINFQLPNEYIGALNRNRLSEEDISNIEYVYRSVISDVFFMNNRDEFTAAMEYFSRLLGNYIEIAGSISFRDFCINFFAASMPQVYIHIVSVAELSRCLTGYLIERRPELFLGMFKSKTIDDVNLNSRKILSYAYNSGLVHDIGKIGLLPILSITEREPFPEDLELLSRCASSGRNLVKNIVSTSDYVNIFFDENESYISKETKKDGYNAWDVKEKAIVDVLHLAGDIDDMAKKLENHNKSAKIKNLLPKLKSGKGTEYAPYLFNVLALTEVQNDIDFILNEGRDDIYRRTYIMLKSIVDRGKI